MRPNAFGGPLLDELDGQDESRPADPAGTNRGVRQRDSAEKRTEVEDVSDDDDDAGVSLYDPGEYNVADVVEYIAQHPDEADEIIAAERAGKDRRGIVGE